MDILIGEELKHLPPDLLAERQRLVLAQAQRGGDLKKLGVVLKRAQYFLVCKGRYREGLRFSRATLLSQLAAAERGELPAPAMAQLSLFDGAGGGL